MWRLTCLSVLAMLTLGGCDWLQDQGGSTTGPTPIVHCDNEGRALQPGTVGDTTIKVNCPGASSAESPMAYTRVPK